MPKALIITEKPSVARDLTAALGGFQGSSSRGWWESDDYLCTFAVGHLLSLLAPEDIDPAYKQWSLHHLPILPQRFQLKPIDGHAERLELIRSLAARSDVDRLVNACDAAREGELIFREIVVYLGLRLPVERLWLQSMTPEAIRQAFRRLRPGEELRGLGDAAACRAKSDWLIGMNATRAFSRRLSRKGDAPWSVGRVQTPTLALLVERELEILGHESKPYFQVKAKFDAGDHAYEGVWFDPAKKKDAPEKDARPPEGGEKVPPATRDDRLDSRAAADKIVASLRGAAALASETREKTERHAPPPYHLTALQKHMATRYKWTAKRTLEAAQRCYESHKVITYPRTGSQCLPSDYRPEVRRLLERLAGDAVYGAHAKTLLDQGLRNERRIFDDAGVTDHFAIVPTGRQASLEGDDQRLFDAVVRRFVAAFHPPAVYGRVRRLTVAAGHSFRTGPVETLLVPGWMAVMGEKPRAAGDAKPESPLPALKPGEGGKTPVKPLSARVTEEATKPPPRISEAGLLSLMEHAGRHVDDEELKAALMQAEGLGTPATRADIIQNLKAKHYVDAELRPTFKGVQLIETLRRIGVRRLTSAELTARLELELAEVERGVRASQSFMDEIVRYVTDVVAAAKAMDLERLFTTEAPLGPCPQCKNAQVHERALGYQCAGGCGFALPKEALGRYLDQKTARELVTKGETGVIDGLGGAATGGKKSRPGSLALRAGRLVVEALDDHGKLTASVVAPPPPESPAASGAGKGAPRVAPCPVHEGGCHVVQTRGGWLCETRLEQLKAGAAEPEGFFLPKTLASRPLTEGELKAYLERRQTGVLDGFRSKAGREFAARIVMLPSGAAMLDFAKGGSSDDRRARS